MPKKRLTEQGVAKLKAPATGSIDYYDAGMPGLVLRIGYGGSKTWRALYYVPTVAKSGKKAGQRISMPTTHELGRFPVLSVKAARDAARAFLADPHKALAQADTGTFKEVAENFLVRHVRACGLRSEAEIERALHKYVYPRWRHRPFRDIRRGDVAALLDQIEDNHGPRQADIVLAIIRKMMNWYASRNDDYSTVIVPGMKRHNGGDHKRSRVLSDDEIRALWTAGNPGTYGAMLKVLLLTGQRKDKVATMKWDDLVDGEWRISSAAREKGNAGSLKLPQAVLDIIAAQPRIVGNPHVFAGRGAGPFNSFSQRKEELDAKLRDMPPWVIHDLRRTARSLLSRAGVRPDIAERVLGHVQPTIVETYDQHTYDVEKADALNRLAALVERIINPPSSENVVNMRPRRRTRAR